jgi:hypothetical protein
MHWNYKAYLPQNVSLNVASIFTHRTVSVWSQLPEEQLKKGDQFLIESGLKVKFQ